MHDPGLDPKLEKKNAIKDILHNLSKVYRLGNSIIV